MSKSLKKIIDEAIDEAISETIEEIINEEENSTPDDVEMIQTSVEEFISKQSKLNKNTDSFMKAQKNLNANSILTESTLIKRVEFLNKITIFQGILLAVSFFMIAFLWIR